MTYTNTRPDNIRGIVILTLVANGATYAEVGRMFGVTRQAVYQYCKRSGMRARRAPAPAIGKPHTHTREPLSYTNQCMAHHGRRSRAERGA